MVWIQYSLIDGSQRGWLINPLVGTQIDALNSQGYGQIEYDGANADAVTVDITQSPPVIIPSS